MNGPLISVIIPIYNMEPYLARCLNSVLENDYSELEIICVNDGSKDKSLEILREYARKDARIRIVDKENGGLSDARNKGMEIATGEFISFLDADDYIHPQFFEILADVQREKDADVVACMFQSISVFAPVPVFDVVNGWSNKTSYYSPEQMYRKRALREFVCGRLYRTSMAKRISFLISSVYYAEDAIYNSDFFEAFPDACICKLSQELYYYCNRPGSLAKANEDKLLNMAEYFIAKSKHSSRYGDYYLSKGLRIAMNARYMSDHIHANRELSKQSRKLIRSGTKDLLQAKKLSKKEKYGVLGFLYVPGLYWLYKIRVSPGMLRWEIEEWKRRHFRKP